MKPTDNRINQQATATAKDPVTLARMQMFKNFCAALESHAIPYVILAGYQDYPDRIDSDVDFMVSDADFRRLPALLSSPDSIPGAQLVQMLQHETSACYYVLAQQVGERIAYLHPDAAAAYRRNGRLWLRSEAVLATRRMAPAGFWIPAVAVEFEYYFVKRVDKALIELRHLDALAGLMAQDASTCHSVLARLLPSSLQAQVAQAISARDVAWFAQQRSRLQTALHQSAVTEPFVQRLTSGIAEVLRMFKRILRPTGLVIAVLGPDGSGKTTIIEHLEREMAPAFRQVRRFHLRPHFGATSSGQAVTNPHSQKPRGWAASVLKTCLFIVDYWLGWIKQVLPAKIRSTFVVFDRYYHDMLVDERRYRLPVHFSFTRWLAPMVPQPDLWLILAAQPEQLVARKGEISLQAAQALTARYAALATQLPNAVVVDTSQSLAATLACASSHVRECLVRRMALKLEKSP